MDKSAQLVSAIKQKASLVDYVSKHIKLQKKGDSYLGLCPFHHEKSPSFTVNVQLPDAVTFTLII